MIWNMCKMIDGADPAGFDPDGEEDANLESE